MIRCLAFLTVVQLLGSRALCEEPARPLRIVLAHGAEAKHWLSCLGKDCVRVESLVPTSTKGDEWAAAERNVRGIDLPDAFVASPGVDDLLPRFWSERLRNQGPIEMITLESSWVENRPDHHRHRIQKVHGLLVMLCPEAKEMLDKRMHAELLRRQYTIERNEAIASQ